MYKIAKYAAIALGVVGVVLWAVMSFNSDKDPNTLDYTNFWY